MSDLIRRDDAIAILKDLQNKHLQFCLVPFRIAIEKMQALPSVDRPQAEWIPCSERLPEEKEVVAIVIKQWDTSEIKKGITYRVDHNLWVGFGRHNEACVWWLPLPLWKGADDGEDIQSADE